MWILLQDPPRIPIPLGPTPPKAHHAGRIPPSTCRTCSHPKRRCGPQSGNRHVGEDLVGSCWAYGAPCAQRSCPPCWVTTYKARYKAAECPGCCDRNSSPMSHLFVKLLRCIETVKFNMRWIFIFKWPLKYR